MLMSRRCSAALLALALLACSGDGGPIKIGVLLPLTGSDANGWQDPITWAAENVNLAGGVAGRKLELVFVDTAKTDLVTAAKAFAADSSVRAVIGPDASRRVFDIAPLFLQAKK